MKNKTINDYKNIEPKINFETSSKLLSKLSLKNISLKSVDFIKPNVTCAKNSLYGIPYSLKDNISTKKINTTGGSLFLKDYLPPFNATVKTLLDDTGAILISKDNMDEFGLGGTGTFSAYGIAENPLDNKRITGGSSSGSSVMVQQGIVPFAIATDTGDSIRRPVSNLGVVGYKPTYGLISRNGIFPYAPSLDHVGIIANNVFDIAQVLSVVAKKDIYDSSSIELKETKFDINLKEKNDAKIAIFKNVIDGMQDGEQKEFLFFLNSLKNKGFNIKEINFEDKLLKLIDPIYKTISYSEAISCYARFSGITFGQSNDGINFDDILIKARTEEFGSQLKRRFIIGSYITSYENFEEVYLKSKKVRTVLINSVNDVFKNFDAILFPGASRIAPLIEDVKNNKETSNETDDALQIANFGGFPSITIPAIKYNEMPLGINIMCNLYEDQKVLDIALAIEKAGK